MKKSFPPSIDWQRVFNRLTLSALGWMLQKNVNRSDPMIKGRAPGDLAQDALYVVLEQFKDLGEGSDEEAVTKLAYRIMKRDFIDLLRSSDYKNRDDFEEVSEKVMGDSGQEVHQSIEDENAAKKYYERAGDDKELIEFLDAVLALKVYKREDVAELLGISPQEVTNRQRRLNYVCTVKERKKKTQISEEVTTQ
jgi:DNA-directed RNA polymerase specialized sigma24 family protein